MTSAQLSILIINWNGNEDTSSLLSDLLRQVADLEADVEILILDNGSSVSIPFWWQQQPQTRVIPEQTNLGYSGAMSVLLREATVDACWLLNNDCRLTPGALAAALSAAQHLNHTVNMPLVLNPDGSIQSRDCYWDPVLAWRTGPYPRTDVARYPIFGDLFVAPLMSRQLAMDLMLLPPLFHTYGEDFDACYALAAAGVCVSRYSDLALVHRKSSSKPSDSQEAFRLEVQGVRNLLVAVLINYEFCNALWAFPFLFCKLWIHQLIWRRPRVLLKRPSAWVCWMRLPLDVLILRRRLSDVRSTRLARRALPDRCVWRLR